MKTLKKIMAFAVCLVMVLAMTVTAFADDSKYTVTINKNSSDTAAHTYEAYQIFKGDLDSDGKKLSNITWGSGIDTDKTGDLALGINGLGTGLNLNENSSASDFADAIAKLSASNDSVIAQKLAQIIGKALSTTVAGTSSNNVISDLTAGYYLIKDQKDSLNGTNGAYTRFMLQVVKSITVNEKASVPTVEKKVDDKNDSNTAEDRTTWQDSADYDIGDEVPFKLTATTADTVSDYTEYHVTFEDTQSVGLNKPTSFTVSVLGKTLELNDNTAGTSAESTTSNGTAIKAEVVTADSGCTFAIKVTLTNSTSGDKIPDEANSTKIEVTYNSVLNSSAAIGATGNPNNVYLKYSNNPNSTDNSDQNEGKTPEDKVIVFTYKAIVNKFDQDGNKLKGADFTIYKKVTDSTINGAKKGSVIKADLAAINESINATALDDETYYITKAMSLTDTVNGNVFELSGIDDGEYVIVETTIPNGYNAFESKSFTISAEHDVTSDSPKLTGLTVSNTFTATLQSGELSANITNNSGSTLPSTGGIGTRIFYIIGGLLMAAAAVVLITKVRFNKNK